MKRQQLLGLGLIVLAIIGLIFILQREPTKSTDSFTKVTVAMDWTPNTNHTGMYVAQAKGWYEKQGIKLNILPYSANVSASNLVLSNKADVGIGTAEDIIGQNAKDNQLVSIGTVTQHNTSGFIVRADSDINSPKDLDGKIYGGYGSPFENPVVTAVIKKDGGTGDFKNVTLNVEAMQALKSNKIDFVWAFEGWEVIQAKRDGMATRFFPIIDYGIPDGPNLAFVATPKQISEQADKLNGFMTATAEGYEYARKNPKAAAQLLIDQTPKVTFADPGLVFDSQQFLSKHYADAGRKWGVQDKVAWQGYSQFMLDSGVIHDAAGKPAKTLAYERLYTNQFVE